ncbi:hypothetical protein PIB30_010798, partial [Stylosanthes scabra]|nr:hypothetical protein [Stylosanthes scabra]
MIEDIEDTLVVHNNNNKDYVDMKSCIKKSPLTYGMVVLFITAVCGMYICSINLEHPARVIIRPNTKLLELSSKVNNNNNYSSSSCYPYGVEEWELPYLHFPQPKTYN